MEVDPSAYKCPQSGNLQLAMYYLELNLSVGRVPRDRPSEPRIQRDAGPLEPPHLVPRPYADNHVPRA